MVAPAPVEGEGGRHDIGGRQVEDRHRLLGEEGELARPCEGLAARGDVLRAGGAGLADPGLDRAGLQAGDDAALPLDRLEGGPGRGGELLGERLEPAGPGRRISHAGEVGFLDQDDLAVAGDTPGEGRRRGPARRYRG